MRPLLDCESAYRLGLTMKPDPIPDSLFSPQR